MIIEGEFQLSLEGFRTVQLVRTRLCQWGPDKKVLASYLEKNTDLLDDERLSNAQKTKEDLKDRCATFVDSGPNVVKGFRVAARE
jgi:hypothetical protein